MELWGSHATSDPRRGQACGSAMQWYIWGPPKMQYRFCATCWLHWRKYGDLKMCTQSEEEKLSPGLTTDDPHVKNHMQDLIMQGTRVQNTDSPISAAKTHLVVSLHTTYLTASGHQVCGGTFQLCREQDKSLVLLIPLPLRQNIRCF